MVHCGGLEQFFLLEIIVMKHQDGARKGVAGIVVTGICE